MTPQDKTIPHGFCQCGCGQKTPMSKQTYKRDGLRRGEPCRYVAHHARKVRPVIEDAVPFKIANVYCRLIPLTQGQFAIVDAADYNFLMQWKWCAIYSRFTRSFYAIRGDWNKGRPKGVKMHRVILGLTEGDGLEVDHDNHCTLDNRRHNIRVATHQENAQNMRPRICL